MNEAALWVDAVVVGLGPAGCAAALALRAKGLSVVAVAQQLAETAPSRVEILPASVERSLRQLGVGCAWRGVQSCLGIASNWGEETDYFDFRLWHGAPAVATSRAAFHRALREACVKRGVEVVSAARAATCERQSGAWIVDIDEGGRPRSLKARLLVEATGRTRHTSAVAPAARVDLDRLIGLAVEVPGFHTLRDSLLLDISPGGWWYAWGGGERPQVVFLTDAHGAPAGAGPRSDWLAAEFERTNLLRSCLQGVPAFDTVNGFDARSSYRPEVITATGVVVGDAALSIDPLSGQGVSLALTGGRLGAEALLDPAGRGAYVEWLVTERERHGALRSRSYSGARNATTAKFWMKRAGEVLPPTPI